ncbi:transcription factor TGA1-like [Brassica napus]|uniref:transcription factor TGA1-like n=1 Tax=Brassica napus TaxID=3708 RepID=UPI0006AAAA9F|nr:transcription factor TGA1-like [Brassica napus]
MISFGVLQVEGSMNSTSTHFVPPRRVGIYEPLHQFGMWGETFKNNIGNGGDMNTPSHIIIPNNQKLDNNNLSEDTSQGTGGTPHMFDQEASTSKHPDKIQRRLAQNREAARKSRLRKKAYVQQLETSRLKLIHLEQELDRARQQGFYVGNGIDTNSLSFSEPMNPGIAAFEMEYGHWIQEQNKQICELRTVLQGQVSDVELRLLVENGMKHYFDLFRMKSAAAKADVFFVMSGMWRTSAERLFLWIGGFRPSDLLKVLLPHFDVMTDQQILDVCNLRQSCQQAEDALSQGMEKLQHTLADCVAGGRLGEGSYIPQVNSAMERLEALVSFVNQADHLRHETLQQMRRILTTRQAARGLLALGTPPLALGEYFQRLRALSSSWATRHRELT